MHSIPPIGERWLYILIPIGLIIGTILLCSCTVYPTTTPVPTATTTPILLALPTGTATATVTSTPCPPMARAMDDTNTFPEDSAEWRAWEQYDALLKKIDAARKSTGNCRGLSAEEQMQVWLYAQKESGVK